MKHFRNTSADEERLHTFVMDYCFSSQGSQQGITVLVIKEMKTKAVGAFMVPCKRTQWLFGENSRRLHERVWMWSRDFEK